MGRGPRPSPALGAREGRYLGRLRANRARSNIVNNYTNNIRIWQVFYCHFTGDFVITAVALPAVTRKNHIITNVNFKNQQADHSIHFWILSIISSWNDPYHHQSPGLWAHRSIRQWRSSWPALVASHSGSPCPSPHTGRKDSPGTPVTFNQPKKAKPFSPGQNHWDSPWEICPCSWGHFVAQILPCRPSLR